MYRLFEMKEYWPETSKFPFVYMFVVLCVTCRYVLTEFSSSYIYHWENNPLISQFFQLGYMDYGIFDIGKDTDLHLKRSNVIITADSLSVPPFIVCSSVLSYLPQDIVMIDNYQLKNAFLAISQYTHIPFPNPLDSYEYF